MLWGPGLGHVFPVNEACRTGKRGTQPVMLYISGTSFSCVFPSLFSLWPSRVSRYVLVGIMGLFVLTNKEVGVEKI